MFGSHLRWRKSSRSSSQANCVEVAFAGDAVLARDSKAAAGGVLVVSGGRWRAFVDRLRQREA